MERQKKTPARTCVACRASRDKRALLRVVREQDGTVSYDPTGKRNGRGAYVCPDPACISAGVSSGRVAAALKAGLDDAGCRRLADELTAACAEAATEAVRP